MSDVSFQILGDDERSTALFDQVRESVGPDAADGDPPAMGSMRMVAWRGDLPVARLACGLVHDLHDAPGVSGWIGHYEAMGSEGGAALLQHACRTLADRGAVRVLGPMNGSTWARYRLAIRPGLPNERRGTVSEEDRPPFLGEPWNPARYPADFVAGGFSVAAHYESRIDLHLDDEPEDAVAMAKRVGEAGVGVRPLDLAHFDQELEQLFALSLECFAGNLYYTPIDFETFRSQYLRIQPLVDPELVLIAEARERPVAFQFAFRDPRSPEPQTPRVIVKTVATSPACRGLGLGGHMLDLIRRRARAMGAGSVIHALMHVRNLSMRMSARHRTEIFRGYELYQWTP